MTGNVYLAGPVERTLLSTARTWRKLATTRFWTRGITTIDPLRTDDVITRDGIIEASELPNRYLMQRCYQDVCQSQAILVNFVEGNYPSFGSIIELGWAWQRQIPVVAVISLEQQIYKKHPMIAETISVSVPKLDDAIKIVCNLLGGKL